MTNIQNFSSAIIVSSVPSVKFGGTKNISDVLMKGARFLDVGLIVEIAPFANLAIAYT